MEQSKKPSCFGFFLGVNYGTILSRIMYDTACDLKFLGLSTYATWGHPCMMLSDPMFWSNKLWWKYHKGHSKLPMCFFLGGIKLTWCWFVAKVIFEEIFRKFRMQVCAWSLDWCHISWPLETPTPELTIVSSLAGKSQHFVGSKKLWPRW